MSNAPHFDIDPGSFWTDPYPDLKVMRRNKPVAYVEQLGATLITRRDDIFVNEKKIDVFSSVQPDGLMSRLMGENMMRKDGAPHQAERKALFPALSPRTVAVHWKPIFAAKAAEILDDLAPRGACDLVTDYAMPVSAEALKAITGLTAMTAAEMDGVSQAMIDGCANYGGDPDTEARCHAATAKIDDHITRMWDAPPPRSALDVQIAAGVSEYSTRANIKLIISGGQNEPRDAIAGTVWALLTHPKQLAMIREGRAGWAHAFAEYGRWMSPIGMSPRRVARTDTVGGVTFEPEDRAFLMFSSACRDEAHFENPDRFDITRDTQAAMVFSLTHRKAVAAALFVGMLALVAALNLLGRWPYSRFRLAKHRKAMATDS